MTVRRRVLSVWVVLSAAIAGWALGAAAQSAPAPPPTDHPLTVEECVQWALDGGPVARSAREETAGAGEAAAAAEAPYWPSLSFSASYSRWQRRIFLPSGIGFPGTEIPRLVGPTNDGAWSFATSYTLFDGGSAKPCSARRARGWAARRPWGMRLARAWRWASSPPTSPSLPPGRTSPSRRSP